jgi:hypothetical protein
MQMYDTEIYASAKDGDELVININSDLENVRKWMLQIHPTKTNKIAQNPILINNVSVSRKENYTCLGVNLDERFTLEKRI